MKAMLSLPPSLLVLVAAATQLRAQQQHPTAIRKMSLDEGEKLFPEHFAFGPAPAPPQHFPLDARAATDEEFLLSGNSSAATPFLPPYPRHYDYHGTWLGKAVGTGQGKDSSQAQGSPAPGSLYRRARDVLAKLQGRQFACPQGTHSCTNIDQPDYCCSTGTTCFVVTNAPESGNVGCCPDGQNCGVSVGACTDGATACPANLGGGCCIAGFVCASVGCVASTVSVISPTPSQTTVTSTATALPSASPTTQVITVIVTVTPSGGGAPVTSTTTQTTTATPAATSSPSPTSSSDTETTNTNTGGIPPFRPTSGSSASSDTASSVSYCPTGFYPCVASAGGGCCRTGRDCSTTSCPPPAASTTIISNGVTVAVPLTDAQAASSALPTATCASGWFLCGADAGPVAGCCPSGYSCGTASCTLSTSTATATVQKELPNSAPGSSGGAGLGMLAVVILVASLYLL
ncbi:hypothetical protein F5Y05DRAFT_391631 [Hypoxylon sp. FL0543]|nr:hypothetical protein F5Y05DRAFT_391631 [Hypoxylon sp. FL0543]